MAHQQYASCVEACNRCAAACDHCATACLSESDPKPLAHCIALDMDCADICRLAVRTCGGRSIMKSMPLERLYRDSRCGSLMLPWTAEICLERLGRESLFEPGERD